MTRDKGLLIGAWAVMAAVSAYSYWKISESPKVDPTIVKLVSDLEKAQKEPRPPMRGFKVRLPDFGPTAAGLAYIAPGADVFRTKGRGEGGNPIPEPVQILPYPVMGTAKATLDGTTLTWATDERKLELKSWMIRKAAKPATFMVFRQVAEEAPQMLAELGPEARSYTDLTAEPLRTYRYWVALTGQENLRTSYADAKKFVTVTNKADQSLTATGPSATRVKLIGGDRSHAVVRLETYSRPSKSWVGKTQLVNPGDTVAGSGWTLKKLYFDDFTLMADLTDDAGVARVLTTRN